MSKELLKLINPTQSELSEQQVRELCQEKKEELGFDIEKALYPLNPLSIQHTISVDEAVKLVEKWSAVRGMVWRSLHDSVSNSARRKVSESLHENIFCNVQASVDTIVQASGMDSARHIMWAYISSIFYGIEKWDGIDHEPGVNPFQPGIDLWEAGYVASFDGTLWRLHTGKDATIVWSGDLNNGQRLLH